MVELVSIPRNHRLRPVATAIRIAVVILAGTGTASAATQDLLDLINSSTTNWVELPQAVNVDSSADINRPDLSFTSEVKTPRDLNIFGESTDFKLTGDKYSVVRTAAYGNAQAKLNFNNVAIRTFRSQSLFHVFGSASLEITAGSFDAENTNTNEWNANVLRTLQNGSLTLKAAKARIKSNSIQNSAAPVYAGSNGALNIISPDLYIESTSQKAVIAQSRDNSVPSVFIDATQGAVPGKVIIKNHNAQTIQSQGGGIW